MFFKAYMRTNKPIKIHYFNSQTIKSFSRGDAFECHIPEIKKAQKLTHVVNKGNLSITSPFELKFMPTKEALLKWKSHLDSIEKQSGQQSVVHSPFGVFSTESVDQMIRLHTARIIKKEVAEENTWLNGTIAEPDGLCKYPSAESVSAFKSLIHSPRYDEEIAGYGMSSEELSKICCNRWLSSDHILWVVEKLNTMQPSTLCVYLNYVSDVKRYVKRRVQSDQLRPVSLMFIMNVGKSPDGSVFLGSDEKPGNHWSTCYIDMEKRTATYADSLAYNVPTFLKEKIAEFYTAIYNDNMTGFSYMKCHDHAGRNDGRCGPKCAKSYPLQSCGSVCGLVAVISAAMACLSKPFFLSLISKNAKLPRFFFSKPSSHSKYLRIVLCTWIAEKTINIANVLPNEMLRDLSSDDFLPTNFVTNKETLQDQCDLTQHASHDNFEPNSSKRTLVTGDSISDEALGPLEHSQKPNGSAHIVNERSALDQPLDINSKCSGISDEKTENIDKEKNGGKKNSERKKDFETPSSTKNSCTPKVYKCPHCSQTCKKLFNLKRHISRYHKNTNNKENEPPSGRCSCLECDYKCHKITELRNHLKEVHDVKMSSTTKIFNTTAGM